jgi:hypothetical protein
MDVVSMLELEGYPKPGTPTARRYGCCCPVANPHQRAFDDPVLIHMDCPLHGLKTYEEYLKGPWH